MDRSEIIKILSLFTAALPHLNLGRNPQEIGKRLAPTVEIWELALGDIPFDLAQAAAMKMLRTRTVSVLPQPGELYQSVLEIVQLAQPTSAEAWGEVERAIGAYGYPNPAGALQSMSPVTRKVVARMGWHSICTDDAPISVTRGQFIKLYEAEIKRRREMDALPAPVRKAIEGKKGVRALIGRE